MRRVCLFALATVIPAAAQEADVVFRSDVSLVRVDAQVLNRDNRAITGLRAEDFVLREEGKPQEVRNFAAEEMPVDIVLLLDVSGSMRSHVERIARAAEQALNVLGKDDRVAIMVFDRMTRLRMPFRTSQQEIVRELDSLLNQEMFNGGTDITRALYDAAAYIGRAGRREARRAIVIMTDDQTERERDEAGVTRALLNADSVLSALLAPDAMGRFSRGGSWPGSGGGGPWGGSLPDIILGRRRGPYGGRPPVVMGGGTRSAGTAEIAQRTGGDSLPVDQASALQTTFERIRQRYALHFYLPDGVRPGQERNIEVELSADARRRYPNAEVRYRRGYMAPGGPVETTTSAPATKPEEPEVVAEHPAELKRRPRVSEGGWRREGPADMSSGPAVAESQEPPRAAPTPSPAQAETGGWKRVEEKPSPGWRRVKPGEQP